MITSRKIKFIGYLFSIYHRRILYKHFNAIHLSHYENLESINNNLPLIFYANHSNWWDGFIAYFISNRILKKDDYLLMDFEQMKKYSFFKYIGVFSVDKSNPADSLRSINYASNLIKNSNRCLWIFPQGNMQHQDYRPLIFYNGIINIAKKSFPVQLIPVAFRYDFIMEQRPEVFIKIGKPDIFENPQTHINSDYLLNNILNLLDDLKNEVLYNKGKFITLFKGKSSRNKFIDKLHKL